MREIKFKLYDPESGYMTKALTINDIIYIKNNPEGIAQVSLVYEWRNLIWRQFTGLKDRDGIDIYDGDIVKFKTLSVKINHDNEGANYLHELVDTTAVVYFDEEEARFVPIPKECEIIGNVFENPELLESPA